ncbi:hypothetical protein B296_00006877 [Ensete ventricosum]|uniref:Uncharacterized protein n=1 Tax=Ensete ventricosum TaxID=4639 RepID=A0A427B419_ENSVE|nr:hypothetical protein B296_00006877 [Ensete ventricosum]
MRLPARLLPYAQYFIPSIWIKIKMNGDQHQITRAFSRTGKGVTYGWRFGPVTGHRSPLPCSLTGYLAHRPTRPPVCSPPPRATLKHGPPLLFVPIKPSVWLHRMDGISRRVTGVDMRPMGYVGKFRRLDGACDGRSCE